MRHARTSPRLVGTAFSLLSAGALALGCSQGASCPLGAIDEGAGCRCPPGEAPLRDSTGEGVCVTTRYRDFVLCMGGAGLKEEAVQRVKRTKASGAVGVTGVGSASASGEEEAVEEIKKVHSDETGGVTACVEAFRTPSGSVGQASASDPSAAQPPTAPSAPSSTPTPTPGVPSSAPTASPPPTAAPTATATPTTCSINQCGLIIQKASCAISCTPDQGVARCECKSCGIGCSEPKCVCTR